MASLARVPARREGLERNRLSPNAIRGLFSMCLTTALSAPTAQSRKAPLAFLSWIDMFFKTKSQQKEELDAYYRWAYPYGDAHKEKINDLIKQLLSNEDEKIAIYNYLVARQQLAPSLYEGPVTLDVSTYKDAIKKIKKQYNSKAKVAHAYLMSEEPIKVVIDRILNIEK